MEKNGHQQLSLETENDVEKMPLYENKTITAWWVVKKIVTYKKTQTHEKKVTLKNWNHYLHVTNQVIAKLGL